MITHYIVCSYVSYWLHSRLGRLQTDKPPTSSSWLDYCEFMLTVELKRPLAVWSPEKTTKLLTKVLPEMTTNLSLASLVAVMMDTALTNYMVTLFLIGCCSGLWRPGPIWQCLQKLSKLTRSWASHCLEPFLRGSFCIERWSHTSLVPTEEDILIFSLEKGFIAEDN